MSDVTVTAAVGHLVGALSDPVRMEEAAKLLHISLSSVYDSVRRFDAARIAGDVDEMRRHIPCIHRGGVVQPDGTFKGGRYVIPREAFIRWYTSAGLDAAVIEELYGDLREATS